MYVIFNNGNPVGCHEDKKICEAYIESLEDEKSNYEIRKLHKKAMSKYHQMLDDIQLIQVGHKFIPYKFMDAMSGLMISDELEMCKSTLIRMMETTMDLSRKDMKALKRVINIIDYQIMIDDSLQLSYEEMERVNQDYIDIQTAKDRWYED